MVSLINNSRQNSLQVVEISAINEVRYKGQQFGFKEQSGLEHTGYEFITTYRGDVRGTFKVGQTVKHGARVMKVDYNASNQTTKVARFFDNRDSLNAEDSYYRASLASGLLAARVIDKTK